jgi:hypothetical protein
MTATRTEPNGQTHVESLPLFFVALIRNVKPQEILKLNSFNHIVIKVEYTELRLALRSATTANLQPKENKHR